MPTILVLNTGSSSLKLGVYAGTRLLFNGEVDGIGLPNAELTLEDATGKELHTDSLSKPTQPAALAGLTEVLANHAAPHPDAIGHRIVHGGPHLTAHCRLTPDVLQQLRDATHFAPLHIPPALELIDQSAKLYHGTPQFACFDTAFHTTMPEAATHYPIPRCLYDEGIRRYGFHGLSYESLVRQLGDKLPPRAVFAHLGSGASLCAVLNGKSIDTTMGLTPTGGIPMATRPGDLDPGLILHLFRTHYPTADALESLLNHQSGLKALTNTSDVHTIEQRATTGDQPAQLALTIFTTAIAKTIAGYATELGGLDLIVFTGGIGEHSPTIRNMITNRLTILAKPPEIRTLPAQEDEQIALHTQQLLRQ